MRNYLKTTILLFISFITFAQKSEVDFQTRQGVGLTLDLPKGWEIQGIFRTRFNENSTNYRGSYIYLGSEKKINKYLSAGLDYRLGMVNGETFHRLSGNVEGKYKINKFTFSLRETYQSQKQTFVGDDEGTAESYLRSRLGIKYAFNKKIDFSISTESFMHKNNGVFETDFWRNRATFSYEYVKNKSVSLYYIWQPDINKNYPDTKNILGINLNFDIKVK